jgi:PIN domain.
LRVILDTSFLLPFLGIRTDEPVMKALPRLRGHELYYSELSVLEALWKIVKVVSPDGVEVVLRGLSEVRGHMRRAEVDEGAVKAALELYRLGHRDLIDGLLYGTALSHGFKLLTIDRTLTDFVRGKGYPDVFIGPDEL